MRVITRGVRPFIRAQQIKFTGDGFRPNTRLYTFFDRTDASGLKFTMTSEFTSESLLVKDKPLQTGGSLITTDVRSR